MSKRSNFNRIEKDAYDTPKRAVVPLLKHLDPSATYVEPCAGRGALIDALPNRCVHASDIAPRGPEIAVANALTVELPPSDFIITNPPFTRSFMHAMIERFSAMRPTWLLLELDWTVTQQAIPYLQMCRDIVPIGRLKWIPDSPFTGKDNYCWALFDRNWVGGPPVLHLPLTKAEMVG